MTHRIIPHPHEARRFLEAGSVLIVREVDYQPEHGIVGESLTHGPYLKERDDPAVRTFCPFPAVGEEVLIGEDPGVVVSRECRRVSEATHIRYVSRGILREWNIGPGQAFIDNWNATSQTPFDADPWVWVVLAERP